MQHPSHSEAFIRREILNQTCEDGAIRTEEILHAEKLQHSADKMRLNNKDLQRVRDRRTNQQGHIF